MIIGENTKENHYDTYREDHYDYMFKRKSPAQRQQKKEERRQAQPGAAPGKRPLMGLGKKKGGKIKAIAMAIAKNKNLVQRNFGLSKKPLKPVLPSSAQDESSPEPVYTTPPSPGPAKIDAPLEQPEMQKEEKVRDEREHQVSDPPEEDPIPESEEPTDSYDEDEPKAPKTKDKSAKKESGVGMAFGWVCLGITLAIIVVAIRREDSPKYELIKRTNL